MSQSNPERSLDEVPPGTFALIGGLVVWAMPKRKVIKGEFSEPTSIVVISAALLITITLLAFIFISVRRGVDVGIRWLLSKDIYLPKKEMVSTNAVGGNTAQESHNDTVGEPVDSDSTKLVESTDSLNSDVIERLRENLDGYEFEEFVAELWRRRGWNARVTRGSGDGNIDVVAEHDMVTGEKRTNREMIQAKHKSKGNTVGVGTVRRTKGSEVVEPQDNLVVVTTGTFTSGAREAAEKNNVELVDKEKLREMVVENMGDNRWE